jgi:hypothetical protein
LNTGVCRKGERGDKKEKRDGDVDKHDAKTLLCVPREERRGCKVSVDRVVAKATLLWRE